MGRVSPHSRQLVYGALEEKYVCIVEGTIQVELLDKQKCTGVFVCVCVCVCPFLVLGEKVICAALHYIRLLLLGL